MGRAVIILGCVAIVCATVLVGWITWLRAKYGPTDYATLEADRLETMRLGFEKLDSYTSRSDPETKAALMSALEKL